MEDLKKKVEALLFSSGRRMRLEEISKLCKGSVKEVSEVLNDLKKEYGEKKSSLIIVDDGDYWKLTTREEYVHLVKNIVTRTELTKTLMETLAVIAFKYPIKQSDLIKIRTNKAYDHLNELEEMGYINRQKYGRTKLIKLTQKFFDYFSLPEDKLKEQFSDFEVLAQAISTKESEIKKLNEEQMKRAKKDKEIDLIDDNGNKVALEIVNEQSEETKQEAGKQPSVEPYTDTFSNLEVIDEPEVTDTKDTEKKQELQEPKAEPKGIELTDEMEDKVEERVNEILGLRRPKAKQEKTGPEKEGSESNEEEIKEEETEMEKEEPAKEQETTEEPKSEKQKELNSEVDRRVEELLHPEEEHEKLDEIDRSKWGREKTEESDSLGISFKKNNKNNKKDNFEEETE